MFKLSILCKNATLSSLLTYNQSLGKMLFANRHASGNSNWKKLHFSVWFGNFLADHTTNYIYARLIWCISSIIKYLIWASNCDWILLVCWWGLKNTFNRVAEYPSWGTFTSALLYLREMAEFYNLYCSLFVMIFPRSGKNFFTWYLNMIYMICECQISSLNFQIRRFLRNSITPPPVTMCPNSITPPCQTVLDFYNPPQIFGPPPAVNNDSPLKS